MKKLLLAVMLLTSLVGCVDVEENEAKSKHWDFEYEKASADINGRIYYFIDTETGVEYIFFDSGYNGGFSPRYNADGTLKINEQYIGEKD